MTKQLRTASAISMVLSLGADLVRGADFKNPSDRSEVGKDGNTPLNKIRVITADQAYNTNQNTMDFSFYVNQQQSGTTFYARLNSKIEMPEAAGYVVHNLMGFKIGTNSYDWLECFVRYDGKTNANANSRFWTISDRYSKGKMPWDK